MSLIKGLFTFIYISLIACSFNSCSDEKEKYEDDQRMSVLINGVEHSVLNTGYDFYDDGKGIRIHLSIEDKIDTEDNSFITFQLPLDATEEWFQLIECESYWRILFRSLYVGNHRDMGLISEGKILVKQLEEKNNNDECKYQVAFEIILSDGTKAEADIQTIFTYNNVPTGGR